MPYIDVYCIPPALYYVTKFYKQIDKTFQKKLQPFTFKLAFKLFDKNNNA